MEQNYITMSATFILDNEITLIFRNVSLNFFSAVNVANVGELFNTKWYMFGVFDTISLLGEKYVISTKTKKKVELIRYNEKVGK